MIYIDDCLEVKGLKWWPHIRGWYVQASMELGSEDGSPLVLINLGSEDGSLLVLINFQRVVYTGFNGVGT